MPGLFLCLNGMVFNMVDNVPFSSIIEYAIDKAKKIYYGNNKLGLFLDFGIDGISVLIAVICLFKQIFLSGNIILRVVVGIAMFTLALRTTQAITYNLNEHFGK